MTDNEMQHEITKEIQDWRQSNTKEPLVFDFEDGVKIIIVKAA